MTREEAIEYLKRADVTVGQEVKTKTAEALEMAIKALEQMPCEDATNGEVIKAVFPNTNIEYWAEYSTYNVEFPNDNDVKHFSYDWWNAKYKAESEE